MSRYLASILLIAFSSYAFSDSRYYCSYLMSFGLSNTNTKEKLEEYSIKDCEKGDVMNISVTDTDKLGREEMYLAGEIAELCDNKLEITVVSSTRAVCTYRGNRRSIRRSE